MKNQTDHTQRDETVELEKRISQLEEENHLLQGIINGTSNTVTVAEPVRDEEGKIIDFRYILFNNAVKRYMGASNEDTHMIGKTMLELFPGTFANGNFKRYVDVVENNRQYAGIEYHYVYDGVNNWFRESCYAYRDCVVVMTEDITDRKRKEEESLLTLTLLKELEEVFELGTYEINTLDFSIRPSANMLKIVHANTQDTYQLDYFIERVHPADRTWVGEKITDCITKDIPYNMEHRINLPNNELKWIISGGKLAADSEGNKTRLLGFLMDITERKKSEQQQLFTNSLLSEAFTIAEMAGWMWKEDFSEVICSPELYKLYGFDPGITIDAELNLSVFHPNDVDRIRDKFYRAIETRSEVFNEQYRIIRANDQQVRYIWSKGGFINGRLIGIAQDITERVEREEKLKRSEALLLQSERIANVGAFDWNKEATFGIGSKQFYTILGSEEKYLSIEEFLSFLHPDDVEKTIKAIVESANKQKVLDIEYRIVRKNDGVVRNIWVKGDYVDNRLMGAILDITERKLKDAELRRSESLLLQSQEIAGLGGWQWNEDFSACSFTPQMIKMFGFTENTKISLQQGMELVYPDDIPNLSNILQNVIETKGNYDAQYRIIRANDKAIRTIWAKGKFINGRLTGVAMDITERKELELKNRQLAIRNDELDSFVYTASHDLRSPLNNMEMLVGFLAKQMRSTQENEKVGIYINMLNKSIADLKNTLEDLTTVTEIHPGEKRELVNLHTIVEEVQVSLYKQIEEAEASVHVDLAVPFLTIPKKHVRSLVFNMLSNALKFASKDRKPEVTISSHLKNDRIQLRFSDNGIGIKEADQPKVFMIFKRFNPEVAGRGVGMYLVKRVIDLNDGAIYLESKENIGTTFHIEFPIER